MIEIKIDKLIRTKRKTILLRVTPDVKLVVRAPHSASLDCIREVILKASSWIKKRQKISREWYKKYRQKEIVNGETFLFLGKKYRLKISEYGTGIELNDSLVIPRNLLPKAKDALIEWYSRQALVKITDRVDRYSKLTGLKCKSIRISNAARSLGACNPNGSLRFTWRVILAPLRIINYLVVHELAHLEHMNHSKKYWDKVKSIMPDYEQRKKWLKDNGHLLVMRF